MTGPIDTFLTESAGISHVAGGIAGYFQWSLFHDDSLPASVTVTFLSVELWTHVQAERLFSVIEGVTNMSLTYIGGYAANLIDTAIPYACLVLPAQWLQAFEPAGKSKPTGTEQALALPSGP